MSFGAAIAFLIGIGVALVLGLKVAVADANERQ
jgi:hypothetical protein